MNQGFKRRLAALLLAVAASGAAIAGPVLIVRSDSGPNDRPTNQAVANLSAWQADIGNSVSVVTALPASLAGYSQVWDLSFRSALQDQDRSAYLGYLQQGGRLAMIGDNEFLFSSRNSGIRALIADAGGGSLGQADVTASVVQTVRAPFSGPLDVTDMDLAAPAYFDGTGRGSWILAQADDAFGSGIAFDEGDLVNAAAGRLISMLDVDIFGDLPDAAQPRWHRLAQNMVGFLDAGPGNTVPEPSALALVGLALAAAYRARARATSVTSSGPR